MVSADFSIRHVACVSAGAAVKFAIRESTIAIFGPAGRESARSTGASLNAIPTDLESVVGQSAGASLVVNESGTILFATDQACHLLKYAAGELHGQSLELLIPERYRLAHIGHRLRFTDDRRTRPGPMGAGLEPFAQCKDGCERRVDITLIPVQRGLETLVVATMQVRDSDFPMPSPK